MSNGQLNQLNAATNHCISFFFKVSSIKQSNHPNIPAYHSGHNKNSNEAAYEDFCWRTYNPSLCFIHFNNQRSGITSAVNHVTGGKYYGGGVYITLWYNLQQRITSFAIAVKFINLLLQLIWWKKEGKRI